MKKSRPTEITDFTVTSEASGFDFENAVDYEDDTLFWRSTDLSAQNVSLVFSGTINFLAILGANFSQITIGGTTYNLAYDHLSGAYRGYFALSDTTTPLAFIVPVQSVSDGYFTANAVCIGEADDISNPVFSLKRQAVRPVRSGKLFGGRTRQALKGHRYRIITFNRTGMSQSALDEFADFKRLVGRDEVFILFEDLGHAGAVYLCVRTDAHAWELAGVNNYKDTLTVREI